MKWIVYHLWQINKIHYQIYQYNKSQSRIASKLMNKLWYQNLNDQLLIRLRTYILCIVLILDRLQCVRNNNDQFLLFLALWLNDFWIGRQIASRMRCHNFFFIFSIAQIIANCFWTFSILEQLKKTCNFFSRKKKQAALTLKIIVNCT